MDWKDILAQKVNDGELAREEFVIEEKNDKKTPDVIDVCIDRKGRNGETPTIASGYTCEEDELRKIASRLEICVSTGVSERGGEILFQGECID